MYTYAVLFVLIVSSGINVLIESEKEKILQLPKVKSCSLTLFHSLCNCHFFFLQGQQRNENISYIEMLPSNLFLTFIHLLN